MRTTALYVDSRPFYDGNGLEVKRQTDTFDGETAWEAQPTKYYIRSSVLKGRVISETWSNGKKHRSYVKGIGNQTAVQSAFASETAQLNELVLFEFSDSSRMSYRTTNKLGEAAATGDGGEGSPIETDPLGGNVGTFTPFIILIGGDYDPEYPELQVYNNSGFPAPNFASLYSTFGSRIADLPGFGTNWGSFSELYMVQYEEMLENSRAGFGFITNEQYTTQAYAQAAAQTAASAAGQEGGTSGDGGWVDQSTGDVNLDTNTVTINGNGYWDFGGQSFNFGNIAYQAGAQLPKCLRDFLRPFFPTVQIGNFRTISPVDDARFISRPGLGSLGASAMTLGLYDINYDPKYVDLTGGQNKSSIATVAEEIVHAVQFIALWEEVEGRSSPNGSYPRAQGAWAVRYFSDSGRVLAGNLAKATSLWVTGVPEPLEDLYADNRYEKEAKEKARSVYQEAKSLAKSPCHP